MVKLLYFLKALRISQWIKNGAIFAPLIFSGFLLQKEAMIKTIVGFGVFCLISSGMYLINDVLDYEKDRKHPFKKKRPIASGKISKKEALVSSGSLLVIGLIIAGQTSVFFLASVVAYIVLNLLYSWWWKKIPILDVLSIASGFILRVYGGSFLIDVHMDVWFLLTVVSVSLFLAVGKRRSEMTLLSGLAKGELKKYRETLGHYTPQLLDVYTAMFANTTWLSYTLFSFLHPPFQARGRILTLFGVLPRALVAEKWLMITVPVVIYGVMRYLQLVYEQNKGESPHKVLLSDGPLIISVGVWIVMVVGILYLI